MNIKLLTFCIITGVVITSATSTTSWAQTGPAKTPAFTPENYTDGEKPMMPLIMKVTLSPDKMKHLGDMMRAGANSCFVEDLEPGNDNSMLMICGLRPSMETFSNN